MIKDAIHWASRHFVSSFMARGILLNSTLCKKKKNIYLTILDEMAEVQKKHKSNLRQLKRREVSTKKEKKQTGLSLELYRMVHKNTRPN